MKSAEDIVPLRGLRVWWSQFECPYCHRTWNRGGHKEGFVKSAATSHVAACWEIVLFKAGFVAGSYDERRHATRYAVPIEEYRKRPYGPRNIRAIKALIASRARAGLQPRRPR